MVATLCFLECSRHGLLERELLELLGEDELLRPPTLEEYTEKIANGPKESSTQTSEPSESLANDLSKKLHVTVEETYRKTDLDGDKKPMDEDTGTTNINI